VRPLPKGLYHNEFSLPELGLANPRGIVDLAVSEVRLSSLNKSFTRLSTPFSAINTSNMECAKERFQELNSAQGEGQSETVSIYQSKAVFAELGLNLSAADIDDIIGQLELRDSLQISFTEVVEIAAYIHGEKTTGSNVSTGGF
jgi:hypothetical protein